ncbi:lipoprotein signal peptidase [Candidatus Photodesmus blepharus]|uniref:Lipoprotein signal peptidase n=1 Tax=Candidatus Photodesmus blepharonis TaxID=1179155 RepID=A0A084CMI3_9GAMM|nr:signal peptidase II [Candidatus Photodesmus blepharus]KEY91012.1 lipoprotein signal peptidase [Candidatus Photodesmus blepharus]
MIRQSGVPWLWLSVLVSILDIFIKFLIMKNMNYGWLGRVEILPFFSLLYVHNYGAAFGFLSDQSGWQRWLFVSITFIIIGILIYWMRFFVLQKYSSIAYALIIGGALGNLFDRICYGFVVDYLYLYWRNYHWPAFNLADAIICVGTAMVIFENFYKKNKN